MKRLITPPVGDVVSLDMLRAQCRVDPDLVEEDALLMLYARAAVALAEHEMDRPILLQTWEREQEAGAGLVRLHPDVRAIESVRASRDGVEWIDVAPGAWCLVRGAWLRCQVSAPLLRVRYRCGAWETPEAVPEPIRQWILLRAATAYAAREAVQVSGREQLAALPRAFVDGLLDPYRWGG